MTDFKISYDNNINRINIYTDSIITTKVSIFGDDNLVYWTYTDFNRNNNWYNPDTNLDAFNVIRIEIISDNVIIGEKTIYKKTNFYGEYDTDKYIRNKFFPDYSFKGNMIELGAGPPVWYSMSKHFRDTGWRCICIDPIPKFVKMHQDLGNEIYNYACSNEDIKSANFNVVNSHLWGDPNIEGVSFSALDLRDKENRIVDSQVEKINVEVKKLNTLLDDIQVDHIDFISVDTEGWELEVMMGFDLDKYNPSVVLLENVNHDIEYTEYMKKYGYELDTKLEYNYIYIKSKSTNYYAQGGEDVEIEKYFPDGFKGGCIDIGATNGVDINNSLHFEELGWYCMCVEPNPNFFNQLKNNRKNAVNVAISDHNEDFGTFNIVNLNGFNEEAISGLKLDERLLKDHSQYDIKITPISCDIRTLDFCVENYYKYDKIDFVSIDTEGTELDVLKGFDINKWHPKLFIIENNYDDKNIEDYMNSFGYVKDQRKSVNDFYIKK